MTYDELMNALPKTNKRWIIDVENPLFVDRFPGETMGFYIYASFPQGKCELALRISE